MNFKHKKTINRSVALLSGFLCICTVFTAVLLGSVITETDALATSVPSSSEKDVKTVYVAGNPDFYPVEFYNPKTGAYEGVLPLVFDELSSKLNMDFEYINGAEEYNIRNSYHTGVHIFSSHIIGSDPEYVKDEVRVISYFYKGKKYNFGLAFTDSVGDSIISEIKREIKKLTPDMLNGYLVMSLSDHSPKKSADFVPLALLCIALAVVIFVGIGIIRKQKRILNRERLTDGETGIGNLAYFEQCYSIIPEDKRHLYAVFYIIIEGSNLQIYHRDSAFNEAIKHTAEYLAQYAGDGGFCARVTESGFVLVIKTDESNDEKSISDDICKELNAYFHQTGTERNSFFRVAAYRLSENDNSSEFVLFHLRHYCNSLIGTDTQSMICDPGMTQREAEEKNMIENIISGFENREFKLYMQFIVDKKTKKIRSAEALSRWHNPRDGVVSPFKYIGVMERSGLISQLDYYMFDLVCQQLHKWEDTELDSVTISCNITRITISEPDFVERIREISSRYIFKHSKLIMEITEDAIEKNRNMAMENMERCKKLGFRIALDDMGSGYTSFMNLCEYPIDIVKIDRDILLKTDTPKGRDLFVGIIALAHSLGYTVVCEGVETEEQKRLVELTDCNYIQGWYYFTPQPHKECEKIAREYSTGIES